MIIKRYKDENRGYPPYHPVMMVNVLLYSYCTGVPSSRNLAKRLEEDVSFRVLNLYSQRLQSRLKAK
jgi:transposase